MVPIHLSTYPPIHLSTYPQTGYIFIPILLLFTFCDLLYKFHLNKIKLRIQNKLQLKLLSPQPVSTCYRPNLVERFGSITYVCAFEKRKSSGFSVTTKADSEKSKRTKIMRFINVACSMSQPLPYPSVHSVENYFHIYFIVLLPKWLHANTSAIFNAP